MLVPQGGVPGYEQDADPPETLLEQSGEAPSVKLTVPVAAPGSPVADSVTAVPTVEIGGAALAVNVVGVNQTTAACELVSLMPHGVEVAVHWSVPPTVLE